jgi:hypothetical protein
MEKETRIQVEFPHRPRKREPELCPVCDGWGWNVRCKNDGVSNVVVAIIAFVMFILGAMTWALLP